MKVNKITVQNLKAIDLLTVNFNGCSAIITGRNNSGKTSFLRSLPDRLRGNKPDIVLKEGEHNGFAEWTLDTGEKLRWEFNDTTKAGEKLIYITDKEVKAPLTSVLCAKFFPETFDVDKFLNDAPAKQRKTLQMLAGVDFTDVDKRYKDAYDERQNMNRSASESKIRFDAMPVPERVERVDIDALLFEKDAIRNKLNILYQENKVKNDTARNEYNTANEAWKKAKEKWQKEQDQNLKNVQSAQSNLSALRELGYTGNEVKEWIKTLPLNETEYTIPAPIEPTYPDPLPNDQELKDIEQKINDAHEQNRKYDQYQTWLQAKQDNGDRQTKANESDAKVQAIQKERDELIRTAKMPEGFGFSEDGILYNNLPFTKEQQSSSSLYIAALKLASMRVGNVRVLHFDASFLDRDNLMKIEEWAASQDLQLLIERPDFNGGEIVYELIEK